MCIQILAIIKKKKEYSDREIINLDFDENMYDRLLVLNYYKNGLLDIYDKEYRDKIVNIFQNDELDENYKSDLNISFHFLSAFTFSLTESIEQKRIN
jgi:hypothetical protein